MSKRNRKNAASEPAEVVGLEELIQATSERRSKSGHANQKGPRQRESVLDATQDGRGIGIVQEQKMHRGKQREKKREKRGTKIKRAVLQHREDQFLHSSAPNPTTTPGRTSNPREDPLEDPTTALECDDDDQDRGDEKRDSKRHEETAREKFQRQRALPIVRVETDEKNSAPYCDYTPSDELDVALALLLTDLTRFQRRLNPSDPNFRARRRLVHGLREVTRAVNAGRLRAVVVAPDVEPTGDVPNGPRDAVANVLQSAASRETPIVFGLNRRKLAHALGLGRSKRASVVGIYSADGAHEKLQLVLQLTTHLRFNPSNPNTNQHGKRLEATPS